MSRHLFSRGSNFKVQRLAIIGLMTAVTCVLAPFSLSLPLSPVPISLATLGVCLCASVSGMRSGFISVALYLLLGLVGVPVFSGFASGPGVLLGPGGGYLAGYLPLALICGFSAEKLPSRFLPQFLSFLPGMVACYIPGALWMGYVLNLSFTEALTVGVIPYIPADLAKAALAASIGLQVRKRLRKAGIQAEEINK